jgi:hypothetical protein
MCLVSSPVIPRLPNVAPDCLNIPGNGGDGLEEICHIVTEKDPDTALCGKDVSDYPWNPPWPLCQACLEISAGRMN